MAKKKKKNRINSFQFMKTVLIETNWNALNTEAESFLFVATSVFATPLNYRQISPIWRSNERFFFVVPRLSSIIPLFLVCIARCKDVANDSMNFYLVDV